MLHDVLLFNVIWPLNRYQMRTLHPASFQMAHLTLKSLERYCPNKRYLYDSGYQCEVNRVVEL